MTTTRSCVDREMNTYLPVELLASRKNYSLLMMGISNGDGDGGGDRWRWLRGHFPISAGCRNRDFMSPESSLWWRRRYETFRGWRLDDLGFLHREASYRRRGRPRGCLGRPDHPLAWPGPAHTARWCGRPLALLRLVLWLQVSPGKIITLAFVPSNSENIHFLTFLEPKTAENRQLALWLLLIG